MPSPILRLKRYFQLPWGERIQLGYLFWSPSMILTYLPFSIALFLTSSLLPPLFPSLAPWRCFRTWVLITYQFFYLSLSLRSVAPTSVPHPSIFRKLAGMTLTLIVLLTRNTGPFFPLLLLSLLLWHWMRPNLPFLLAASNAILNPSGPLKWKKAVSERRKVFAPANRSDKDRQAYIFVYRRALFVIAKAKAETWQATCSSFLHKSNPKFVYSLLRSVAGSSSSSFLSPNFPNCFSPSESASVFAAYLRYHFSVSHPKALRSRTRSYLLISPCSLPLAQTKAPIPS